MVQEHQERAPDQGLPKDFHSSLKGTEVQKEQCDLGLSIKNIRERSGEDC